MATPSIVMTVGDDWVIPIRWTASDEPVDLTGYVVTGELYHSTVAEPILLTAEIASQGDPANTGWFTFRAPKETTAAFRPDPRGTYGTSLSIVVVDPAGSKRTWAKLPIRSDARRFADSAKGFIVTQGSPAPVTVPGSIGFGSTTLTVDAGGEVTVLTVAEQGPGGNVTVELLEAKEAAVAGAVAATGAADVAGQSADVAQTAKGGAEAARDTVAGQIDLAVAAAAEAVAAKNATNATANGRPQYATAADLPTPAATGVPLQAEVQSGTGAGTWGHTTPNDPSTPWVKTSGATLTGVDVAIKAEVKVRDKQARRKIGLTVPAWGLPSDPFARVKVRPDGKVVRAVDDKGRVVTANRKRTLRAPFTSGLSRGSILPNGKFTQATRRQVAGEDIAIASVETRLASAPITGRMLQQAWLRRSQATIVPITGGPYEAEIISADLNAGTAIVRRQGRIDAVQWRAIVVTDGNKLHLVMPYGQSLAQGKADSGTNVPDRFPAWRDPVAERVMMFDSSAWDGLDRGPRPLQVEPAASNKGVIVDDKQLARLVPLRGSGHAGDLDYFQTVCESAGHALVGQHLHHRDIVIGSVVGTGSTASQFFTPGSAHMQSAEKIIDRAHAVATTMGKQLWLWVIPFQGEQDNTDGVLEAVYIANWTSTNTRFATKIASLPGAVYGGMIFVQCMQNAATQGMAAIAQAKMARAGICMLMASHWAGPGASGGTHLLPLTYLPLGSGLAYIIAERLRTGVPYVTPRISVATLVDANTIDCTLIGGTGAFEFDTSTIPDTLDGMKGASLARDTGGTLTIASISLPQPDKLRIVSTQAMALNDNVKVRLGLSGSNALLPATNGPRVCIRDTSRWRCNITSQIASGWMTADEVPVVAA